MTVVINFVQGLLRDRITAILHKLIVDDGRHHDGDDDGRHQLRLRGRNTVILQALMRYCCVSLRPGNQVSLFNQSTLCG